MVLHTGCTATPNALTQPIQHQQSAPRPASHSLLGCTVPLGCTWLCLIGPSAAAVKKAYGMLETDEKWNIASRIVKEVRSSALAA